MTRACNIPKAAGLTGPADVFVPKGAEPFPICILIHGGRFTMGDKQSYNQSLYRPLIGVRDLQFDRRVVVAQHARGQHLMENKSAGGASNSRTLHTDHRSFAERSGLCADRRWVSAWADGRLERSIWSSSRGRAAIRTK